MQYYQQNGAYYTLNNGQPSFVSDTQTLQQLRSGNLTATVGNYFGGANRPTTPTPSTGEIKSPVSLFSTENAKSTVNKLSGTLDQISPTTSPNYVPPKVEAPKATVVEPKAYFTNSFGQEAQYTDAQLKDQTTQKFLTDNGYVMTKTEGPSYDTGGKAKADVASTDAELENLKNEFASYKVENDTEFASRAANIHSQYDQIRQQVQRLAGQGIQGLRTAALRYGARGGVSVPTGLIDSVSQKLAQSVTEENNAISDARAAVKSGKYTEFNNKMTLLDKIRTNKKEALDNYQKVLGEVISQNKEKIKTAQDAKTKLTDKITEITIDAKKNNAPPEVIDAIQSFSNSGDLAGAVKAAGDYLQSGTGIIGEYTFYKRDAVARGQVPVDFNTYQNMDANRKIAIAKAGNASGLDNQTLTRVQSVAGQFDNEPTVKNYQVVAEGKNFIDSISNDTTNPADDIGAIYAFAKIMDPNSVVREGEYATVQKYAQTWAQTFGFKADRIFSNSKFLTSEALANMKATISSKAKAAENNYKNIYNDYGRKINKITGKNDGKDWITDYSQGFVNTGQDLVQSEQEAEKKVVEYGKTNPTAQTQIMNLATNIDPTVGRPYTYQEIMQILNIK